MFTKGPWEVTPIQTVVNARTRVCIGAVTIDGRPQKELTANAHLIAAAPDLYEACKTAEQELEQRYGANEGSAVDRAALKIIKTAIAKAEGKE